jgi:DNA-binding MarR family transcriptional regulator
MAKHLINQDIRKTSDRVAGRSRDELLHELMLEVRRGQVATDRVDQSVADLMGVNRTDARCLDVLDQRGRLTAGQLAEASGLTTGAVTAMLDRLERAGFVRRLRDKDDRRRVLVEITPDARRKGHELFKSHIEKWPRLSERYSDEEIALMLEFARIGRENNEELAAELQQKLARKQARGG